MAVFQRAVPAVLFTLAILSCNGGMSYQQANIFITAKQQYMAGNLDEARRILRSGDFRFARGHQGKILDAKILFIQGHTAEAEDILCRLLKKHPGYTEAQLWLARAQLAEEKLAEAQTTIEQALEFNPEDPRFLSLMGTIQEMRKDYRQALEYQYRASMYGEDLARTEIALAQLYYQFGQDAETHKHIQRAQALISQKSVLRRPLQELENRIRKETAHDQ